MFTTWRYEPPEACELNTAWPRRYDIWSYGCVILEFIVWLLGGSQGLDEFNKRIVDEFGKQCHYFEREMKGGKGGKGGSVVHRAVLDTMQSLSRRPECQAGKTALGDLLRIVRTKLLVVALDSSGLVKPEIPAHKGASAEAQVRANSSTLSRDLAGIIKRGTEDRDYWLNVDFKIANKERDQTEWATSQSSKAPAPTHWLSSRGTPGSELLVDVPVGTVYSQLAIDDNISSGSSAASSLDYTNAASSKTGAHISTNPTVPTTSGNIDQEISDAKAATKDDDQYSAAGSAAPYNDQYIDVITTTLLRDLGQEDLLAVETMLPSLLKECAIRIGHEDRNAFHRKMMFFAHQHHAYVSFPRNQIFTPAKTDHTPIHNSLAHS